MVDEEMKFLLREYFRVRLDLKKAPTKESIAFRGQYTSCSPSVSPSSGWTLRSRDAVWTVVGPQFVGRDATSLERSKCRLQWTLCWFA